MSNFATPYFVTPHAVKRFQVRVDDIFAAKVIGKVQELLQENKPISTYIYTYEHKRMITNLYIASYNDKVFYLPVSPGEGKWPAVVSILPLKHGIYPRFRCGCESPRNHARYTRQETEALRVLVTKTAKSHREIARITGRTQKAIAEKCFREGIFRRREKNWGKLEEKWAWHMVVIENLCYQKAAFILHRSHDSVKIKVHRMQQKLRRTHEIRKNYEALRRAAIDIR